MHPINEINDILGSPDLFLNKILRKLKNDGIDVSTFELDHICYRVETMEDYAILKTKLLTIGKLLSESQIGDRAIATINLEEPIIFKNRKIWCIELPAPKEGSFYPKGYEHVEFVIDEPFSHFLARYPKVTFDKKGLVKKVNADLRIQYADCSVKFHLQSLEQVIKAEKTDGRRPTTNGQL